MECFATRYTVMQFYKEIIFNADFGFHLCLSLQVPDSLYKVFFFFLKSAAFLNVTSVISTLFIISGY